MCTPESATSAAGVGRTQESSNCEQREREGQHAARKSYCPPIREGGGKGGLFNGQKPEMCLQQQGASHLKRLPHFHQCLVNLLHDMHFLGCHPALVQDVLQVLRHVPFCSFSPSLSVYVFHYLRVFTKLLVCDGLSQAARNLSHPKVVYTTHIQFSTDGVELGPFPK